MHKDYQRVGVSDKQRIEYLEADMDALAKKVKGMNGTIAFIVLLWIGSILFQALV